MTLDDLCAGIDALGGAEGSTAWRLKRTLQRAQDADPVRAFVYRADAYNKVQPGWPHDATDGSSSVLVLAGAVAFIAEPGDLTCLNREQLLKRLEAAEQAVRDAALAYFGGPREGGLADSLLKAQRALARDDRPPTQVLSEILEGSADPGTNALRMFLRGLHERKPVVD